MNFVIPMAGAGNRFLLEGYDVPKMFLRAKDKTLLEWSVDSLPLDLCTKLIFIYQESLEEKENVQKFILEKYPTQNIHFIRIPTITRGQAETVYKAVNHVDMDKQLVIFNIDTRFSSRTLKDNLLRTDVDGVLGSFKSDSDKFSFAELKKNSDFINRVAEKIVISEHALTGLYSFKKAEDFFRISEHDILSNKTTNGEFYIAPMYNKLILEGKQFVLDEVNDYDILGTPKEYKAFLNKY